MIREWTVLVYMNDNNNLCKGAKAMLKNQLAAVEPSDQMAVAVEYSHLRDPGFHYPPSVTHARAELKDGKLEVLEQKPYENMADQGTVERFLEWGIKSYPAKRYAVVIQSHGGAWRASMPDDVTRIGAIPGHEQLSPYDDGHGRASTLSLPDLSRALGNVWQRTGVKPDVLAFDSCLMSNMEAAYELRDRAGVLIGSEDIISSTPSEYALDYAVPMKDVLQRLADRLDAGQPVSPETFAKDWVETCKTSWTTPTQTALNLERMQPLAKALDELAAALLSPDISPAVLKEVAARARNFCEKDNPDQWDRKFDYKIFLYDLKDLAKQIAEDPRLAAAAPAARDVMLQLEAARIAHQAQPEIDVVGRVSYGGEPMFRRHEDYDEGRTHGLSIYLPDNPDVVKHEESMGNRYEDLAFARDVRWGQLVRKSVSASG